MSSNLLEFNFNSSSISALNVKVSESVFNSFSPVIDALVDKNIASRILAKDFTIWGKEAEEESSKRLGWVDATTKSKLFLDSLYEYKNRVDSFGFSRVVLAGMGGSSLAPEVICNVYNKELVVLDSTDPQQVLQTLVELDKTIFVVSSKSGSTVETDSALHTFEEALLLENLDPKNHIVIVTDPNSPFEGYAEDKGYTIFNGDPQVGGRFSALTAFGLVPSCLAGVDVKEIISQADDAAELLFSDCKENPALILGAALACSVLATGHLPADKAILLNANDGLANFADWVEQLVAESSGKNNRGILPIVADSDIDVEHKSPDFLPVYIGSADRNNKIHSNLDRLEVLGNLGASFLLWEIATCVACYLIEVNPFDQPNVESAKAASRQILAELSDKSCDTSNGDIEVQSWNIDLLDNDLNNVLNSLDSVITTNSYLALMIYANRNHFTDSAAVLRRKLVTRFMRPVTLGWGPRFLHSTGQLHKGGAKIGVFLQIQISSDVNLPVVGKDFTYKDLITAQAEGDAKVLTEEGLPVIRIVCPDYSSFELVLEKLEK